MSFPPSRQLTIPVAILYWDHCLTFCTYTHTIRLDSENFKVNVDASRQLTRCTSSGALRPIARREHDEARSTSSSIDTSQTSATCLSRWCSSQRGCRGSVRFFPVPSFTADPCTVLFTLRIYALYALDRRVYIGMFGLGAALLGLSCVRPDSFQEKFDVQRRVCVCVCVLSTLNLPVANAIPVDLAVPWEALFLYDIVIFAALMLNVVKRCTTDSESSSSEEAPFGVEAACKRRRYLFRNYGDGEFGEYRDVLYLSGEPEPDNIGGKITHSRSLCFAGAYRLLLRGTDPELTRLEHTEADWICSMSVTLTSRLMLNLHAVGRTGVFSANTRQEEDASDRLGGESELELDTLYTEDLERSMAVGTGSAQQTRRPAR
ncbi:hypothetical protein C8F01DRAFT_1330200 [Mycena amicta]|nr:hypothetical protein C8F01DRAFT_1330200 [Mycena amicta]